MAALQVASYGPQDGEVYEPPFLVPIGLLLALEVFHRRMANKRLAWERASIDGPVRKIGPSPWTVVFIHQLAFYAILHYGWNRIIQVDLGLGDMFFLPAVGLILPWFAMHASALYHRWRVDEGQRIQPWPLASYFKFNYRVFIVPLLPCLIFSITTWLATHGETRFLMAAYPSLELLISLGFTVLIVTFSPFLVRLALGSQSMPPGPMRTRFEEIAKRGNFRFLDIRVAQTHNRVVNAMFVGVLGRLRYVFLTDAILTRLSEEDLAGVFAHEMGHSKRGHILLNMAMFLGLSLFMHVSIDPDPLAESSWALIFLYPFFIFFIFSPVAKAFESEADTFAGETLGDEGPIKRSLETLGRLYPKRLKDGGLVHPSIENRIHFLGLYFKEPALAQMFRARMRRVKTIIVVFLVVPLFMWLNTLPYEFQVGALRAGAMEAASTDDGDRAAALMVEFKDELDGGIVDPGYMIHATLWQTRAIQALKEEDFSEAGLMVKEMRRHRDDYTTPIFTYNTSILSAYLAAATGDWPRLQRERRRAEVELDEVEALAPGDPQIEDEKRDIQLLTAIEIMARRLGALPPAVFPQDLPRGEGPEMDFLRSLDRSLSAGDSVDSAALEVEKLQAGWKRAALGQLKNLLRPNTNPRK